MTDFPWYPQIDGCQGCGATDQQYCVCDYPKMLVFDAEAWREAGGDVGDNSCFWKPAEIVVVHWSKDGDHVATIAWENGKESRGHFLHMMREIEK